ncbi:HigA family addiction module antitoxin [Thiocystis violascens]|uniref:Addiction module antidote protein, HigA family n=1 Tax=Thiocystis violascens (strain ATCC 17096 / DSM 198 / 6111) TaxID=765911 RepID=I3Y5H9_THIV6|nr:HigA family addiction module antitoxin [Thiocystis violascens]AFL72247.1 addiction module antidote protein, HigA family [Thiocystis violascens DSM 198]
MDRIKNIHPGEVLREEFLEPMGISQYRLVKQIGIPAMRISEICAGKRAITADTALRFSRALGTTSGFWLSLQADYDTEEVLRARGDELSRIQPLAA